MLNLLSTPTSIQKRLLKITRKWMSYININSIKQNKKMHKVSIKNENIIIFEVL